MYFVTTKSNGLDFAKYDHMCTDGLAKTLIEITTIPLLLIVIGCICCCQENFEEECRNRTGKKGRLYWGINWGVNTDVDTLPLPDTEMVEMVEADKEIERNKDRDNQKNSSSMQSIADLHNQLDVL